MTAFKTLRSAMTKRASYLRTKRELERLPVDHTIEDLGFFPGDAAKIARQAVYGY